jgi:hypothetical protein
LGGLFGFRGIDNIETRGLYHPGRGKRPPPLGLKGSRGAEETDKQQNYGAFFNRQPKISTKKQQKNSLPETYSKN